MGCWNSKFVECLPMVEILCMSCYPIKMQDEGMSQTAMNFIDHQDYSYVILDHLH
ncbi:hypothetical protein Hanom_Chr16g01452331 [Helianthus anomalus]